MMTGEMIFGGIGSGLVSMLMMVLLAAFLGGLMVGRTSEYLGKKLDERVVVKLVVVGTVAVPMMALVLTALAASTTYGRASLLVDGPQGFTETAWAYASQAFNKRLGVRGLHRLRVAQRAGQRWRVRHHVRRRPRRPRDARGPLRPAARSARRRRRAGGPARGPARSRHPAHGQRDLRRRATGVILLTALLTFVLALLLPWPRVWRRANEHADPGTLARIAAEDDTVAALRRTVRRGLNAAGEGGIAAADAAGLLPTVAARSALEARITNGSARQTADDRGAHRSNSLRGPAGRPCASQTLSFLCATPTFAAGPTRRSLLPALPRSSGSESTRHHADVSAMTGARSWPTRVRSRATRCQPTVRCARARRDPARRDRPAAPRVE